MNKMSIAVLLLAALLSLTPTTTNASFSVVESKVLYVTHLGTDVDTCTIAGPCDLQTALGLANSGDQIWVAAGTYKTIDARDGYFATFQLKSGVAMYGGYPSGGGGWTTRDWLSNKTILSGDTDPSNARDSLHVVTSDASIGNNTILDGFVITEGFAVFGYENRDKGGGWFNMGGSPSLNNITFEDNWAGFGGGMYNNGGNPTLTNVTFYNNLGSEGGGMFNTASNPDLTDTIFTGNTASMGGGLSNHNSDPTLTRVAFTNNTVKVDDDASSRGGGMYNADSSHPVLSDISFTGNTADHGGGMFNNFSSPELSHVTFFDNTARVSGGGMLNNDSSDAILVDVIFSSNDAVSTAGGMYNNQSDPVLERVTFSGNTAENIGGMANVSSKPTLTDCVFDGNQATETGGMSNTSCNPTLLRVSFSNNIGSGMLNYESSPSLTEVDFINNSLGGMYNAQSSSPILRNVTFENNYGPEYGGGMRNYYYSSPELTNVTFSDNSATTGGGAMYNYEQSNPILTNVTITNNLAGVFGGGIVNFSNSDPVLTNVILWGNQHEQIFHYVSDGTSVPVIAFSDVQGCGGSTAWNAACGTNAGGNIDYDPLLGLLSDNGGFSRTHTLLPGSPAIDAGDPDQDNCPDTDQRGVFRPIDYDGDGTAICDMGAVERGFQLVVEIVGDGVVDKAPIKPEYKMEEITLTAAPAIGWAFSGWLGGAQSEDNPLKYTIEGDTTITATFTPIEYTLYVNIAPVAMGTVTSSPPQATYHYDDEVLLTPKAVTGWRFAGWGADATGSDVPLEVIIKGNTNITATFEKLFNINLPIIMKN